MTVTQTTLYRKLSIDLLTDNDVRRISELAPHDIDVSIEVWAAFLGKVLGRGLTNEQATVVIAEYNRRLTAASVGVTK